MPKLAEELNEPWVIKWIDEVRKSSNPEYLKQNIHSQEGIIRKKYFPEKLYRYRKISKNECDVIFGSYYFAGDTDVRVSEIWLSTYADFKDDDCLVSMSSDTVNKWNVCRGIRDYCCEVWGYERFRKWFDRCHSSNIDVMYHNISELFLEVVKDDTNYTDSESAKSIFNDIVAQSITKEKREPYVEYVRKGMLGETGICCFTTTPSSSFMWKKYSRHPQNLETGMCIEYDMSCLSVSSMPYRGDVQKVLLYPAYYSDEMPDLSPLLLNEVVCDTDADDTDVHNKAYNFFCLNIIATKKEEFYQEKEWRFVIPSIFSIDDEGYNKNPEPHTFPMVKPSVIYLGCDVTDTQRAMVRETAERCKIRLVQLHKLSEDNYSEEELYTPPADFIHRRVYVD